MIILLKSVLESISLLQQVLAKRVAVLQALAKVMAVPVLAEWGSIRLWEPQLRYQLETVLVALFLLQPVGESVPK